jgi:hypothetical protein
MRWQLLLLALVACKQPARGATRDPRLPVTRAVAGHGGSQSMSGGAELLASQRLLDWRGETPVPAPPEVRLSRGPGKVERTVTGWLAGTTRDRAVVATPEGAELVVEAIGLAGAPEPLGRVPADDAGFPRVALAEGGAAVLVGTNQALYIVRAGQVRTVALEPGERVDWLAGHPTAALAYAAVARDSSAASEPLGARGIFFATDTGAIVHELARNAPEVGRSGAFDVAGALVVGTIQGVRVVDPATGASTDWGGPIARGRVVVSADGRRIAYADQIGTGDGAWADPACVVRYFDEDVARTQKFPIDVGHYGRFCGDGPALAFVGDELWIAGP